MKEKIKKNKISIIGFPLIILSIFLIISNSLTQYIRPITSIFLMGSSKGKDIIFFGIFGSLLLLSPLFSNKILKNIEVFNLKNWKSHDFLKISLVLTLIMYLLGIILEISLRLKYNVPINTTFISMDGTNINTSSIIHSHLFKSVIGELITKIIDIPSGIHIGTSLLTYTPIFAYSIFLALPLIYIANLFAIHDRHHIIKILLSFSLSLIFISLFDGGILSRPGLIGLFITIMILNWNNSKKIISIILPLITMISLIAFGVIISLSFGTNTYYDIYLLNPDSNINITDSIDNLEEISNESDYLVLRINSSLDYNEMDLTDSLTKKLNGKCDGFFITVNTISYLKKERILDKIFN